MTNTKLAVSKNGGSEILETVVDAPLTAHQKMAYESCCKIVSEGLKTFIQVGEALMTLREGKLYRAEYPGCTWDQFLEIKWGFTRQRANQLISASSLAQQLGTSVTVPNERIARVLGKLDDAEAQRLALTTAIATAPEGKLTADWVEGTVDVVIDAMHTGGLVDTGKGAWSAMNAAITHEVWQRMQTKRSQVAAKGVKPLSFVVDGGVLKVITPGDADEKIDDSKQYRIVVYEVAKVEGK